MILIYYLQPDQNFLTNALMLKTQRKKIVDIMPGLTPTRVKEMHMAAVITI